MKIFSVLLALGLVAAIVGMALVIVTAQGQAYTAVMLNCGGDFRFAGPHIANFADEHAAKSWADGQLAGIFEIAYIYQPSAPNILAPLLWVKSDGACLGDGYRDWIRP